MLCAAEYERIGRGCSLLIRSALLAVVSVFSCSCEKPMAADRVPDRTPPSELLVNDLEPAAVSLKPEIGAARQRVEAAGAGLVAISGSGPTVFGIYPDRESAEAGSGEIGPEAIVCRGGAGL